MTPKEQAIENLRWEWGQSTDGSEYSEFLEDKLWEATQWLSGDDVATECCALLGKTLKDVFDEELHDEVGRITEQEMLDFIGRISKKDEK
jgi:hypothetical protein